MYFISVFTTNTNHSYKVTTPSSVPAFTLVISIPTVTIRISGHYSSKRNKKVHHRTPLQSSYSIQLGAKDLHVFYEIFIAVCSKIGVS